MTKQYKPENKHTFRFISANREIRRVSKDWKHPKNKYGNFEPLFSRKDYEQYASVFLEEMADLVRVGTYKSLEEAIDDNQKDKLCEADAMPVFENPTHYQAYETTSEGTPISPVFENLEDLLDYLTKNARIFGKKATKEEWKKALDCH